MLRHLRVTNFAILSDVAIELAPGMNVLTGETGAGKSLIVEAVNLLRGGRASADIPRAGANEAVVEAIFEVPTDLRARVAQRLEAAGLPDEDGEVLVRRVIQRGGRSRAWVNGALTTAGVLAEVGALLVDLSGQHEHQGLVDPGRHREILDAFAGQPALPGRMAAAWERLAAARAAREALAGDEQKREERIDYLRFQVDEIDGAELRAGEDAELDIERARLQAVDKLGAGAGAAEELIYGGDGAAVDRLAAAVRELDRLAAVDPALAEPLRQLAEARLLVEEVAATLRRYGERLEGDPERLAWVDDRMALLARLRRKHGGSLADVIERAAGLRRELDDLERRDERLAELDAEVATAEKAAAGIAAELTASRRRAGQRLCSAAAERLGEMGMAAAELSVVLEPRPLGPEGADRVELLLRANKGEEARPLARIASGGELSRIMLAVKLALRRADEVATYVFDEVDAGIGGATAEAVGRLIRALADERQVLCVTHLPQIAVFADGHFVVAKLEVDGRTETLVRRLADKERRDETARMLGGAKVTPRARAHADELLRAARNGAAN